jgi:hypothetical protein
MDDELVADRLQRDLMIRLLARGLEKLDAPIFLELGKK